MEVTVTRFRAELAAWVARARAGEEIVLTERGTPVARLSGVDAAPLLDRLTEQGVLARPTGAPRPRARGTARVAASGPVADLVGEQRR